MCNTHATGDEQIQKGEESNLLYIMPSIDGTPQELLVFSYNKKNS